MKKEKIAVMGTGSWGTALAQVLADNDYEVLMYGNNKNQVEEVNLGTNAAFFQGVRLNPKVKATTNLKEAIDNAAAILLAVPTKATASVLEQIKELLTDQKIYFINASKGFDPLTNDRMSQTIRRIIPEKNRYEVASIIGPSHAEEVILRYYTAIASVSLDHDVALYVQKLFSNNYMRLYTLADEIGAEYGVAIKNVLALCSGIVAGIGLGDNTRAALLTRGLQEMIRYGCFKGGEFDTYLGLTGIGDLIVTATSQHSRNFQAGFHIGQVGSAKSIMDETTTTIEGIRTCKVVYEDAKANNIDLPIIEECYHILFEDEDPRIAIDRLMNRRLKAEK